MYNIASLGYLSEGFLGETISFIFVYCASIGGTFFQKDLSCLGCDSSFSTSTTSILICGKKQLRFLAFGCLFTSTLTNCFVTISKQIAWYLLCSYWKQSTAIDFETFEIGLLGA